MRYSHGENAAIIAANKLHEMGVPVRNVVTIATPVREYRLNEGAVERHINIYDIRDIVQSTIGMWDEGDSAYSQVLRKLMYSSHKFEGATNIDLNNDSNRGGSLQGMNNKVLHWLTGGGHRDMMENPETIESAQKEVN